MINNEPTYGTKQVDGSWSIDGLTYLAVGETGPAEPGDVSPIVWGDPRNKRQPLALLEHRIEYGSTAVKLAWPTFRQNYQRTNCLDFNYNPGPPMGFGNSHVAIIRDDGQVLFRFRGSSEVNFLGGALSPWFLAVETIQHAQESRWLDFSVLESGNLIVLAVDDFDSHFEPIQWPVAPDSVSEDGEQSEVLRSISPEGLVLWEYRAPIRSVEYPDTDPGGGGGDPGGGAS